MKHPSLWLGCMLLGLVVLPAALSVAWTPWLPLQLDIVHRLSPPSARHLLGTDPFGRDLFSILMVGARNTLIVALPSIALAALIGVPAGLAAAAQGHGASLLMRAADLLLAFPPLLSVAMIAAAEGPGVGGSIAAISIFNVPGFIRLTQAEARAVLSHDFIAAARVAGCGPVSVFIRHVLPNIAATLMVQATLAAALAVLAESGLSYLGLGVPPPAPSLGRALADYQESVFDHPLLVIAPGVAISLLVLGLNQLGDGLRDLLDPREVR